MRPTSDMSGIDTENLLKKKLSRGEAAFCLAVTHMNTVNVAMIAAACGFDMEAARADLDLVRKIPLA
jgi:hypothetical protein